MIRRKKFPIAPIVAIAVTGVLGMIFVSMINSKETKAVVEVPKEIVKQAPMVKILTAKKDIAIGSKITPAHFMWRAWPESLLNPDYITKNSNPKKVTDLHGGVVHIPMVKGEPIIANKIVSSGDRGVMASLLRKGMRAVSVPISAISSAGGFILPGDRVDILFTSQVVKENLFSRKPNNNNSRRGRQREPSLAQLIKLKKRNEVHSKFKNNDDEKDNTAEIMVDNLQELDDEDELRENDPVALTQKEKTVLKQINNEKELLVANNSKFTEILIENARVLAIDQIFDKKNSNSGRESKPTILGASATLEVTPEQAKLLAWSVSTGTLTLSLRAMDAKTAITDNSVPITKTSFAWPLEEVLKGALADIDDEVEDVAETETLEVLRSGRVSVLNSISHKEFRKTVQEGRNVVR